MTGLCHLWPIIDLWCIICSVLHKWPLFSRTVC